MAASTALTALHEINCHLRNNFDCAQFMQTAFEIVEARMGYELLAILLYNDSSRSLQPEALSRQGQGEEFLEQDLSFIREKCLAQRGITHWVAEHGTTARVDDVLADPRYLGVRDDIRSELCVPIRVGNETLGVINTETSHLKAYDTDDEAFLETVAVEIAIAIKLSQRDPTHDTDDFLTVCAYCNNVRRQDSWVTLLNYLYDERKNITHGVCPTCYVDVTNGL